MIHLTLSRITWASYIVYGVVSKSEIRNPEIPHSNCRRVPGNVVLSIITSGWTYERRVEVDCIRFVSKFRDAMFKMEADHEILDFGISIFFPDPWSQQLLHKCPMMSHPTPFLVGTWGHTPREKSWIHSLRRSSGGFKLKKHTSQAVKLRSAY